VKTVPVTLKELLKDWVERPDLDEVRTREVNNAVRDFLAIHDIPDIEIGAISYEMIAAFFREIAERPARSGIRNAWRDLPHPEMMEKFRKSIGNGEYARIKTPTVTKIGNAISSMLNEAVRRQRIERNPFQGNVPRIPKRERRKTKYGKFVESDAHKLLAAPLWTGHKPTQPHTRGSVLVQDGRYWIMPILAWSGMRLGEVAQLRRTNIQEEFGILYFEVTATHELQSLKEVSSERRVPVHRELVEADTKLILQVDR
jgi:integrase